MEPTWHEMFTTSLFPQCQALSIPLILSEMSFFFPGDRQSHIVIFLFGWATCRHLNYTAKETGDSLKVLDFAILVYLEAISQQISES